MTEYTPTTEEVRKAIKAFTVMPPGEKSISVAEFDRWLNQELAKAWDEGFNSSVRTDFYAPMPKLQDNPYKKEQ